MSAAKDSPDTNGVILLGEIHGDDLGKAISEALDEFFKSPQNEQYNKIGCFREDFQSQVVRLQILRRQINAPVLPLEPPEGEIMQHENLYDIFIPKSLPYIMSSVYPLLKGLSTLFTYIAFGEAKVDSVVVLRNADAGSRPVQRVCREIQSEFEDVIITIDPLKYNAFRESMKAIFPNEEKIFVSLQNYKNPENTAKFIELYNIVYDYYSTLISQKPQYAEFAIRQKELLTLPDGKGVQVVVFPDDHSIRLMRLLRSERDELMVQKLTDYMREDPQPKRVNVVVVGNDHVANMTRLLKVPPFKLLQVNSTQLKPQKGALVLTHGLSKEELNGKYGIVINPTVLDSKRSIRTLVFLGGMKVADSPLGLKRENFEVIELEPRPDVIKQFLGSDDVVGYVKTMGGSNRYKKCSKRRCYARTRKGKRSKRRSAKKY